MGSIEGERAVRLIIAGGRDYQFSDDDLRWLDVINSGHPVSQVVSGHAGYVLGSEIFGADLWGEEWARRNDVELLVMRADWQKHGKAAGPIRNEQMAKVADAVALFPGGRGTASMRYC